MGIHQAKMLQTMAFNDSLVSTILRANQKISKSKSPKSKISKSKNLNKD